MTTVAKNALEVFDPAKLKISHSDYAGKTSTEARKAIRVLLEDYNVVVATEDVDKAKITPYLQGEDFPDYIQSYGQLEGATWVRAYYDGSDNTGAIKNGHPVVMDTVKGNAVTGINITWATDEYKIVGVAMQDYSTPSVEGKRIQVRLVQETPPPTNYNDYAIATIFNASIDPCNWESNNPISGLPPPEFPEGTGLVYVPKKKSNGKYAYERLPGTQKILNFLPFLIPWLAPATNTYWVTYLNGAWLIKRPVDRPFRAVFTAEVNQNFNSGLSAKWNDPSANGSNFGIAQVQGPNSTFIQPTFPGVMLCHIQATICVEGAGSTSGGSNQNITWRSDVGLAVSSAGNGSAFSRQTTELIGSLGGPIVTGTLTAGKLVSMHHVWWDGFLGAGLPPIHLDSLWFNGVSSKITGGELTIIPFPNQP